MNNNISQLSKDISKDDIKMAGILWNYHHLNQDLRDKYGEIHSDALIVCGSNEIKVAERAVELFFSGDIGKVVFSGGTVQKTFEAKYGDGTTEAEAFSAIADEEGLPRNAMIIENSACNTPQNLIYSKRALEAEEIYPESVIIVCAPQHERRVLATAEKCIPEYHPEVTSPKTTYQSFMEDEKWQKGRIEALMGHLLRLYAYERKGDIVPQTYPPTVLEAYRILLKNGYSPNLNAGLENDLQKYEIDLELTGIERPEKDFIFESTYGEPTRKF